MSEARTELLLPQASAAERVQILEEAVRDATEVYLRYIDPANRVTREDALNQFIAIFDRRQVAEAAGVTIGPRPRRVLM
jgi:hypothetical protein